VTCLTLLLATLLASDEGWRELPSMTTPRQEVGVAGLDGKVYVIGGLLPGGAATGSAEVFNVTEERWDTIAPLPGGARLHHVGAAAVGGRVYAVGGLTNPFFNGVRTVSAYDPDSREWSPREDLPTPRGAMGVATLDGKIYAAGGQGPGSVREFAVYDPALDHWTSLPPLPSRRNHLTAVALGGFFYTIGGRSSGLLGAVERYEPSGSGDPEAGEFGTWESVAALPTPRAGIAAAVAQGRVYVFGGEGNNVSPNGIFDENEMFDPLTDRWFPRCPMPVGLHGIGAAEVDGVLYVAGGSDVRGFGVSTLVYAYTPPPVTTFAGDTNGDGELDLGDVGFLLLRTLFPPDDACTGNYEAADVNVDGARNLLDVIYLLDFLFRAGPPPRAAVPPEE
jgi:hypothetical protein